MGGERGSKGRSEADFKYLKGAHSSLNSQSTLLSEFTEQITHTKFPNSIVSPLATARTTNPLSLCPASFAGWRPPVPSCLRKRGASAISAQKALAKGGGAHGSKLVTMGAGLSPLLSNQTRWS